MAKGRSIIIGHRCAFISGIEVGNSVAEIYDSFKETAQIAELATDLDFTLYLDTLDEGLHQLNEQPFDTELPLTEADTERILENSFNLDSGVAMKQTFIMTV